MVVTVGVRDNVQVSGRKISCGGDARGKRVNELVLESGGTISEFG